MIEELSRFIKTANNGNLTRTAEKLFITQSALTQSIQRLEKQLGTKLFVQKGKILQLTTDGEAIVHIGTKILSLWEKAKDIKTGQSYQSAYTIGAFDNAALQLGNYIQKNLKQNTFKLELVIDTSQKLLSLLQLGLLDVAICVVDKKIPFQKNLILIETFTEDLIPVSSKLFTEKIEQIPFIFFVKESHTRGQIDEVFINRSLQPNIFAESTSITFMKKLALLGSGVAFLPENEINAELKQKLLKKQKLPFAVKRTFGLYLRKDGAVQKNHPLIRDLIYNLK